jgi:hypothetical protein
MSTLEVETLSVPEAGAKLGIGRCTVQKQVRESIVADTCAEGVERSLRGSVERLENQITALQTRGNINLLVGIGTTFLGLAFLIYFVFTTKSLRPSLLSFVMQFGPRLSFVIFMQVFAYFFLRLYKSSLEEIKYFQNEITNIECRLLSLTTAIRVGQDDACREVLVNLGLTERNHILEKGQTTVELEKTKIDIDHFAEITQKLLGKIAPDLSAKSKN